MKGLLLKDFYMMKKYCKAYVLIVALFLGLSMFSSENMLMVYYPCLLLGVLPVNLLGYDERFHWNEYCGTLPYTKAQIVSGKYIIGLIVELVLVVLTMIAQMVRMIREGGLVVQEYLVILELLIIISMLASSFSLPFMFKFGVEKGRIAYFVTVGFVCGASAGAADIIEAGMKSAAVGQIGLPALCVVAVGIFAFSWYLSIRFYEKKEKRIRV